MVAFVISVQVDVPGTKSVQPLPRGHILSGFHDGPGKAWLRSRFPCVLCVESGNPMRGRISSDFLDGTDKK